MITLKMLYHRRHWQLLSVDKACYVGNIEVQLFYYPFMTKNMEKNQYYDKNFKLSDSEDVLDFEVLQDDLNILILC